MCLLSTEWHGVELVSFENVPEMQYLGVWLTEKLSWSHQIEVVSKRASDRQAWFIGPFILTAVVKLFCTYTSPLYIH